MPASAAFPIASLRSALVACTLWLAGFAPALAQAEEPSDASARRAAKEAARPYGAAEFGVGVLALPDADVCGVAGCDQGDVSLEVEAWPLFRASPRFAIGAGLTLALTPIQEAPQGETLFAREHTRRYLMVEGVGRYYYASGPAFEAWLGLTTGLVVVSDNFKSTVPRTTPIGSDSANIATEGLTLGLATGVTFRVASNLHAGASLRLANWFLPARPDVLALGEEASLSNRVTMIGFSLSVTYHGR